MPSPVPPLPFCCAAELLAPLFSWSQLFSLLLLVALSALLRTPPPPNPRRHKDAKYAAARRPSAQQGVDAKLLDLWPLHCRYSYRMAISQPSTSLRVATPVLPLQAEPDVHATSMLLFTPSLGFVDLRRKVMSEPSLLVEEHSGDPGPLALPSSSSLARKSLSELQQIPTELWHTRRRIEAGLREQRRQREMLIRVQDQLGRCRLAQAQWRTRSHSPPSDRSQDEQPVVLPQRPSTSWATTRRDQGEQTPAAVGDPKSRQIGLRLSLLEQQLEHLSALTSQSLVSRLGRQKGDQLPAKRVHEVRMELTKLRRRLNELKGETEQEVAEMGRQMTERMRTVGRRLRREWLRERGHEAEKWTQRCHEMDRERETLLAQRVEADRRATRAEQRRTVLERVLADAWALLPPTRRPARTVSGDASEEEANDLAEAVRTAIAQAADTERRKCEREMEMERERLRADMGEREKTRRDEWTAEKREARLELERRETDWLNERAQLRRETERWKAEAAEARRKAETAEMDATKERSRAEEAEREAKQRAQRAEDDMAVLLEAERSARRLHEGEASAERARGQELVAQRDLLEEERDRLDSELRESRAECEEFQREGALLREAMERLRTELTQSGAQEQRLRTQLDECRRQNVQIAEQAQANIERLAEMENQLSAVLDHSERVEQERGQQAQLEARMEEADAEMDLLRDRLTNAEQRLRAERDARLADADRADHEWEEQIGIVAQMETQREQLERKLADAERRAAERGASPAADDGRRAEEREEWARREEQLQRELRRMESELERERERNTELAGEIEQKLRVELERARAELARKVGETDELREHSAELEERLADAEHRLGKAGELCRRLNAELDELSERSLAHSSSADKLRAELSDVNSELVILRTALEEQKRRNARLEGELRHAEKDAQKEKESRLRAEEALQLAEMEGRRRAEKRESEWRAERGKWERDAERRLRQQHEGGRRPSPPSEDAPQWKTLIQRWEQRAGQQQGGTLERVEGILNSVWERLERTKAESSEVRAEKGKVCAQLASTRQMLFVQQEEESARDSECKGLRAKLAKTEAALREISERAKGIKQEAERELQKREEQWQRERAKMEIQVDKEMAKWETERKIVNSSTDALKVEKQRLEQELTQVRTEMEGQRVKIASLEHQRTKSSNSNGLTDGERIAKAELAQARKEWECTRTELAEVKRQLAEAVRKAERAQERLDKMLAERSAERVRWEAMLKKETDCKFLEGKFRAEMEQLRLDWRKAVGELETTKRLLREAEALHKELETQLQRVQRESSAQKQHIEALEMDRRRVEAVIRQTTLERNALDKSLAAMEAENVELQRQCGTLQAQVESLIRDEDGGEKARRETVQRRRIQQLEAELNRSGQEKRKLSKLLEQRESSQETRVRLLENRLEQSRVELETERRKRRKQQPGTSTSVEWR